MDQVRRISAIIGFCLMTVLLSGCSVGGDPEPPETNYVVVRFKEEDYAKFVIVEKDNDKYHRIVNYWTKVEYEDYSNLYTFLHAGCYTGNNCFIPSNCVLTKIEWKDFSTTKHGYWFTKEEIVDEQPFAAYYCVPEHIVVANMQDYYWKSSWPSKEACEGLNALIDSGDIEQYRVDLGY